MAPITYGSPPCPNITITGRFINANTIAGHAHRPKRLGTKEGSPRLPQGHGYLLGSLKRSHGSYGKDHCLPVVRLQNWLRLKGPVSAHRVSVHYSSPIQHPCQCVLKIYVTRGHGLPLLQGRRSSAARSRGSRQRMQANNRKGSPVLTYCTPHI